MKITIDVPDVKTARCIATCLTEQSNTSLKQAIIWQRRRDEVTDISEYQYIASLVDETRKLACDLYEIALRLQAEYPAKEWEEA